MTETPKRTKSETARIVDAERAFQQLPKVVRDDILGAMQGETLGDLILSVNMLEDQGRKARAILRESQNLDADGRARLLRVLSA